MRGAVSIAQRMGVSTLMIGLTVVAFGTSAPEFVTALTAAARGLPGMAIGNIVGSNIANILLIVGVAALVCPFECSPQAISRDGMMMLVASCLFVLFAVLGGITAVQGFVLVAALFIYLGNSYLRETRQISAKRSIAEEVGEIENVPHSGVTAAIIVIASMAGLALGSRLLVSGGIEIAGMLGVPDAVIGLTLIAIGTSLPELATVVMASIRRHGDVAMGNVVGSNIFNLLAIGGGVALIQPMTVSAQILRFDIWVMLGVSVFLVAALFKTSKVGRIRGAMMFLAYLLYVSAQFGPLRHMFDI